MVLGGGLGMMLRVFVAAGVVVSGMCRAQTPLRYEVRHTSRAPVIDGQLDDMAWREAAWSSDFVDILGEDAPKPQYRTRVKLLWDDSCLYIAAELEEPNVHAALTEHDSVIFHDNDFELFVKPVLDPASYYEFEMNARNTTWDLFLNKPYRLGGKADNSWEAAGIRTAVHVDGTLNEPGDTDRGWTVEIALPLTAFASRQAVLLPVDGSAWRLNFSRVEWLPGHAREENWVWSPQGVVDMHVPERWGTLVFRK